jgi:hypothetical protein
MEERYSYRLIRDLFSHKDAIFSELKRASSLSHTISVDTRPRAISTDESNRKANMEARARAIIAAGGGSRSRNPSPAPSPRGHRRDRSSGGPETRFPIASPTATTDQVRTPRQHNPVARHSLEVPGDAPVPASSEPVNGTPLQPITNGSSEVPTTSATYMPGMSDGMDDIGIEKRNSLGRSGAATGARYGRRPVGLARMSQDQVGKRDSVVSLSGSNDDSPSGGRVGVSLMDRPMDD